MLGSDPPTNVPRLAGLGGSEGGGKDDFTETLEDSDNAEELDMEE